jgi:hypothetical protein
MPRSRTLHQACAVIPMRLSNVGQLIAYQPNDGAVMAPKPPLLAALSSGFIVPFSIGQSLRFQASAWMFTYLEKINKQINVLEVISRLSRTTGSLLCRRLCQSSELGQYFLFVLICPACPQFAHFRVVPVGFSMDWAGTADREPTLFGSIIDVRGAFAFSRAWRRSLFLSRRASSSLILLYV